MSDRFNEALRHLGHIYEQQADRVVEPVRIRHVLKVFVPTGNIAARCGSQSTQGVGCPALYADSNCEECQEMEGLLPALTKRGLMLDLVNIMCDVEQMFLDAMYWNFHNPDETPINPDPDGVLANGWIESQMQIIQMMGRFEPTMKKHEGRFNWPTDLDDGEELRNGE